MKKRSSTKFKIYGLIFFILIFILLLLILSFFYFRINTLEIYGKKANIIGLEKLEGQNIFLLNENSLRSKLLLSNITIEDIHIKKLYPNKLQMIIKPKEIEIAILSTSSAYLASLDGIILNKIDKASLPTNLTKIENIEGLKIGDKVPNDIKSLINISKDLKNANLQADKIKVDNTAQVATFVLPSGTEFIISLTRNNETLPASLQLIMTRFRIEGREPTKIDFRFDKPIVTLNNEK
ncbi:hypothetical protein HY407_00410 [Candidatus Gottesmanbacteria bacterium]|nr:hypothetical protein [Candidatus Gottesmanbacteria bacterium]